MKWNVEPHARMAPVVNFMNDLNFKHIFQWLFLTLCMLDDLTWLFRCLLSISKINFFKTFFRERYQSVKRLDQGHQWQSVGLNRSPIACEGDKIGHKQGNN